MDADTCTPQTPPGRLLIEEAKAHNHETLGRVVDASLERAAELRREREARQLAERREEQRQQRLEETERLEQQEAQRTAQRQEDAEERQEAIDAQRRAVYLDALATDPSDGPLDRTA